MDPLSISTAVVTFLAFSGACAKHLRRIIQDANHAPAELLALSNEVSDIDVVVNDLEDLWSTNNQFSSNPEVSHVLTREIAEAKTVIHLLQGILLDLYVNMPKGKLKFQRYMWVKYKSKVVAMQQRLVTIKRNLALLLASGTASRTMRIELCLQKLQTTCLLQEHQIDSSVVNGSPTAEADPANDTSTSTSDPGRIVQNASSAVSNSSSLDAVTAEWRQDGTMSTFLQSVKQVGSFASVSFHVNRLVRCDGDCDCICHSRSQFQSPQILSQILGTLFIGYAGLPISTRSCNRTCCNNQYSRTMQVSYTFPSWLFLNTIDFVAMTTHRNEPCFGLKVRNRVPNLSGTNEPNIFTRARQGDLMGIIDLFKQRKASPNDISLGGYTPIHYALELGQVETCQFLLSVGVDPFFRSDGGVSDAHDISMLKLSKTTTQRAWDYDAVMSRMSFDHGELWDFTFIHSVVNGIHHADLESVLLNPIHRVDYDKPDACGRTPLIWAALRGETRAVELLILAGADVNHRDPQQRTPLHGAIQNGSMECVDLLLRNGARIDFDGSPGHHALQVAAWADDNPLMIERICNQGADVNRIAADGTTALQSAACLNHPLNGARLIARGANLDHRDKDNDTPIFEAIRYQNTAMLKVLLDNGARTDLVNNHGQTILHIAAADADVAGVCLLLSARIRRLDPYALSNEGLSAQKVLEKRSNPPVGFVNAFEDLLQQLQRDFGQCSSNDGDEAENEGEEEEEEFCDAVESHETLSI